MPYSNEYVDLEFGVTAPFKAIAGGRLGRPNVVERGGQNHVVTYTFVSRPQVGDVLTVNGVDFTWIANGATPSGNEIALGATTLAQDLTAAAAALNASADTSVDDLTYSSGATTLVATADADAVISTDEFTTDTASATVAETQRGVAATPLPLTSSVINLKTDAVTQDQAFTLADGLEGQLLSIFASGTPGGNFVVTPANIEGGTALTFDAAGEYAALQFLGGEWRVLKSASGVLA